MRLTWLKPKTRLKTQQNLLGVQAGTLLKNEAFLSAMEDTEVLYTSMWKDSGALDTEAREKLYLVIQILKKLKFELSGYYEAYIVNMKNEENAMKIHKKGI